MIFCDNMTSKFRRSSTLNVDTKSPIFDHLAQKMTGSEVFEFFSLIRFSLILDFCIFDLQHLNSSSKRADFGGILP